MRLIIFIFLLIAGCATLENAEERVLRDTFYRWRDSLINGKPKETYELTSSASRASYKSFEEWQEDYQRNKAEWVRLFKDAKVLIVAIDGNVASLLVRLGTGGNQLFTAVKEEGSWKIGSIKR